MATGASVPQGTVVPSVRKVCMGQAAAANVSCRGSRHYSHYSYPLTVPEWALC